MVIDTENFYGKRKNEKNSFDGNIEKYNILKRMKSLGEQNKNIKKKIFYKQHEALLCYNEFLKSNILNSNKNIILYTEELDNSKRCFIVDNFSSFLKYYCFYSLSLSEIYFDENVETNNVINKNKNNINENKNEQEMNLYELIITNEKRWLFFDIEYDIINNYENKKSILFIFLIEFCLFMYKNFNIEICLNDFLILDSSSSDKISFHIIVKNIHTLDHNYYEYLIDYCYFFLNQTNLSKNTFYDKYKEKQRKSNLKDERNYLLFDNEESIKYFVDLFIAHINEKIDQTENIFIINSSTIYLEHQENNFFNNFQNKLIYDKCLRDDKNVKNDKNLYDHKNIKNDNENIKNDKNLYTHRNTSDDKDLNNDKNIKDNNIMNTEKNIKDDKYLNNDKDINDNNIYCYNNNHKFKCDINYNKENENTIEKKTKKKESQYFYLYQKELKDIIEHYINILKNKDFENEEKYNYIILLYARKKNVNLNEHIEDYKYNFNCYNVMNENNFVDRNFKSFNYLKNNEDNDIEKIKNAEKFIPNDHNLYEKNKKDILLKCIIDNSVYSKNRNFRMIFSSKKNKKNKLLLSNLNVKKYNRNNIYNVILKSLVTFHFSNDANYQINEEKIFKNEKINDKSEKNCVSEYIYTYKHLKSKQFNSYKNISLDKICYNHINNILKIIFFWNFELYKNFRKNKIYINNFQNEIKKEYFYRIILIYNNMKFENFKEYANNNNNHLNTELELKDNKKNTISINNEEKSSLTNTRKDTICKSNSVNINSLDNYDTLFLKNDMFHLHVLSEYKKAFNNKNDDILFLIKYFLYSISYYEEEYVLNFRDNKYCKNKKFSHKSNHIYIIYNYNRNLFVQKCYDNDCSHFVSEINYL
ncbi:conserved Plasmodium protein, unknown function [Plasmodium gallinaceum]|uniref:DNA-directed primase/polymerase protein n=1 Tax=Plasmodium gallinaceum TaxID=5849 RepID=A0A1J1GSR5_PLAGA|nr:conserved Plasmodium protein, unknown function [Plasmodium gallinaceum]CRG95574.1 conserved Plasmodium protein, unknown function [Plasmodium gallinaceum]